MRLTQTASYIALQFGRIGLDAFVLDFQYPFSPLQAFGIALAALSPKFIVS